MYLKAYTILDTKTGVYAAPFFVIHEALAIRTMLELGRDVATQIGQYPADFCLYRIGEYDDNTGGLFHTAPVNLGSAAAILAQEQR